MILSFYVYASHLYIYMLLCCISCFFKLYVHVYAYLRVVLPFLVYCDVAIRLLYFTNRHMYIYIYISRRMSGSVCTLHAHFWRLCRKKSKTKQKPDSIRSESDRIGLVLPIGGGHIFSKSRSFNDRGPKNNKIDDVCCCVSWRGILLREANSVYNLI